MDYDFLVCLCALNKIFSFKCAVGSMLLANFKDVTEIFRLGRSQLTEIFGPGSEFIEAILDSRVLDWAQAEVDWASSAGIELLPMSDSRYPKRLKECDDAPLMLYCKGDCDLNPKRVMAVVGTRRASFYGRDCCHRIVERMGSCLDKPLIVSGLALGIDGVAHLTALDNKLPTVAVLPCGLDDIYPPRHRELAERIMENGALVTDFSSGSTPMKQQFVRRNRIIAGMADAVLVCESFIPGGSLITARLAASYSRELFAVPGRMNDLSFAGCNKLIADQLASIVNDVSSVAVAMDWVDKPPGRSEPTLFDRKPSGLGKRVLSLIGGKSALCMDELLEETGASHRELAVALLELEMDGRISMEGGKYVIRH